MRLHGRIDHWMSMISIDQTRQPDREEMLIAFFTYVYFVLFCVI